MKYNNMGLIVKNLSVSTQGQPILRDISFAVPDLGTLALIGPSGSGKTTLVKAILGLLDNFTIGGQVFFDQKLRPNLSYIPQELALWPHLSVQKTLEISQRFSNKSFFKCEELISSCGLIEKAKHLPKQLSGGEKQRLALARALVSEPSLLVLDEPFSGLDMVAKSKLIALIKDLQAKMGFGLIFISHDLDECLKMAQKALILDQGRIFWQGESLKLAQNSFPKEWNPWSIRQEAFLAHPNH